MSKPYLGLYFKRIFNVLEKKMNKNLEKLNLTSIQVSILIYIFKCDKTLNQRDIERTFNLTNPTVNGILNRLENKGFITKKISKIDARNKEIYLTDKSIKLNETMLEQANNMERKIVAGISEEQLDIFYEIMEKILYNIEGEEQ